MKLQSSKPTWRRKIDEIKKINLEEEYEGLCRGYARETKEYNNLIKIKKELLREKEKCIWRKMGEASINKSDEYLEIEEELLEIRKYLSVLSELRKNTRIEIRKKRVMGNTDFMNVCDKIYGIR